MTVRILLVIYITFFSMSFTQAQQINQYDDNGKQHGKWVRYYPQSQVKRYEGQFNAGVPVGEFLYYYESGKLQTKAQYEKNGTVCYTTSYYGNGEKIAEGIYVNKLKDGEWKYYDGSDNVIAIEHFVNGKKHGASLTYLPGGQLIEEKTYVNGKAQGVWKRFYRSGKPHFEGGLLNDHWHGQFVFFNVDGKKIATGAYQKSVKEGDWSFYDEKGLLIKVETYQNGRVVSKKVFQKDKDIDFIEIKEFETMQEKIKSGQSDNAQPDNPFGIGR
jgi:antitoxin component YwqK of YwqJK toxin-antitoxin module